MNLPATIGQTTEPNTTDVTAHTRSVGPISPYFRDAREDTTSSDAYRRRTTQVAVDER
jgi:hypothetical protein